MKLSSAPVRPVRGHHLEEWIQDPKQHWCKAFQVCRWEEVDEYFGGECISTLSGFQCMATGNPGPCIGAWPGLAACACLYALLFRASHYVMSVFAWTKGWFRSLFPKADDASLWLPQSGEIAFQYNSLLHFALLKHAFFRSASLIDWQWALADKASFITLMRWSTWPSEWRFFCQG